MIEVMSIDGMMMIEVMSIDGDDRGDEYRWR